MLRLTVSLSVVLGLAAATGEVLAPSVVLAAPEPGEDPVADWDKQWERALKDAGAEYLKIADKYQTKLEATSTYIRRYVLRYLPDDEGVRKYLGYVKTKESDARTTVWERDDVRRDQINEFSDLDDPKSTKYFKDKADADKKVVNWFKGLARKAAANGLLKDASPDAKWSEKAARAWDRVLEVDDSPGNKDAEEAHKVLGHPKFEGKLVSPIKFKYVKARSDRQKIGMKEAALKIAPVEPVEPDGVFVKAGFTGGGGKSEHFVVISSHGKEVALRNAASAEKALIDVLAIYGFPETIKERVAMRFNLVKNSPDDEEFRKLMEKGFGWKPAEVTKYIDGHLVPGSVDGEQIGVSSGGVESDDNSMSSTVHQMLNIAQSLARSDLGSSVQEKLDDWLFQSVCYDVTKRVNGTVLTFYGAFGRYGEAIEARPGEDKWVELARRLVQSDDDVPLAFFPKLQINNKDFKGPHIVKGWALIQFLFEKDPEKAKTFIWNALANGTANAVAAVYPDNPDEPDVQKSMALLDAEYREWILKAW